MRMTNMFVFFNVLIDVWASNADKIDAEYNRITPKIISKPMVEIYFWKSKWNKFNIVMM